VPALAHVAGVCGGGVDTHMGWWEERAQRRPRGALVGAGGRVAARVGVRACVGCVFVSLSVCAFRCAVKISVLVVTAAPGRRCPAEFHRRDGRGVHAGRQRARV
jgi:hypothetical protein